MLQLRYALVCATEKNFGSMKKKQGRKKRLIRETITIKIYVDKSKKIWHLHLTIFQIFNNLYSFYLTILDFLGFHLTIFKTILYFRIFINLHLTILTSSQLFHPTTGKFRQLLYHSGKFRHFYIISYNRMYLFGKINKNPIKIFPPYVFL